MEDDSKVSAIGVVKETAETLKLISDLIADVYTHVAKNVRPEYKQCAEGFLGIVKDLRGYAGNVLGFLAPYYYFSFSKDDAAVREEFQALAVKFRGKSAGEWISQLKFRCAEIEPLYANNCQSWINNKYGEHVSKQKQLRADKLLTQLTTIDAKLIDTLSAEIMVPLTTFVNSADRKIYQGDLGAAAKVHQTFRRKVKHVFDSVEQTVQELETAALNFKQVAAE